jgi:hypothetical protein
MKTITPQKYRANFSAWLRRQEETRAQGDSSRLDDIAASADDYLLKRWLWTICVIQIPVAFILIPFLLSILAHYISAGPSQILWVVAKSFMALSLLLLVATIVFTASSDSQ